MFCLIYVDDLILTGSCTKTIQRVIDHLSSNFALKDHGRLNYFLGVEAIWNNDGLLLMQSKYVRDLLDKATMSLANGIATPSCSSIHLHLDDSPSFEDAKQYRSIVGGL